MIAQKQNSIKTIKKQNLARFLIKTERPILKSRNDVETIVFKYFSDCDDDGILPSVQGLALSLGFDSMKDFIKFGKNSSFRSVISRALLVVEKGYVEALQDTSAKQTKGMSYLLNNLFKSAGYSDKHEINLKGNVDNKIMWLPPLVAPGASVPSLSSEKPVNKKKPSNKSKTKTQDVVGKAKQDKIIRS